MNTEPEPPQITSASDEKARLECEKLKAEITAIRKPIYQNPSFYAAILPVILAILGLIFTWSSGWFDVQRTRISNEKTLLETQTERLRKVISGEISVTEAKELKKKLLPLVQTVPPFKDFLNTNSFNTNQTR